MKITKDKLLFSLIIVPFLKPNFIDGTRISIIWDYWQYIGIIIGVIYAIVNYKRLLHIKPTTLCIVLFYGMQLVATRINNINIMYDLKNFVKFTCLIICVDLFLQKNSINFIKLIYKVFKFILFINLFSIVLFWNTGITHDSYNTAIYFWSTKNHIIGIVISALSLGVILKVFGYESKKKFNIFLICCILNVVLLKSSTAIVAIIILTIFILFGRYLNNSSKIFNLKNSILMGSVLHILIVFYNIQEHFSKIIYSLFEKNATFTGRTGLWQQALLLIKQNWLYGKGNPLSTTQSGWLTMSKWNSLKEQSEYSYFVAHNQFLEILLNGGIICFIPFYLAIIFSSYKTSKVKNNELKKVIAGAIFSYFIVMITEVLYPYAPVYIFMVVISFLSDIEKKVNIIYEE